MSLVINHNMMAMNATRNLNETYGKLATSTRRLSSGLRVGTAADDAAGLAMRELMRADINTLGQGLRNANDGISMIQTADGALQVIDAKLIRMKELAEQAATGTYTDVQRQMIDDEYQAMSEEITRIAEDTDFNSLKLLEGFDPKYLSNQDVTTGGTAVLTTAGKATGIDNDEVLTFANDTGNGLKVTTTTKLTVGGTATDGSLTYEYDKNGVPTHTLGANTTIAEETFNVSKSYPLTAPDGSTATSTQVQFSTDGGKTWSDPVDLATLTADKALDDPNQAVKVTSTFGDNKVEDTFTGSEFKYEAGTPAGTGSITLDAAITDDKEAFTDIMENKISSKSGLSVNVHFGSSSETTDYYAAWMGGARAEDLGVGDDVGDNVRSAEAAKKALDNLTTAIRRKDDIRAGLGATQNRLSATIENVTIQRENLQASESRISDVDIATEMTEFTRNQVMSQAAVSMLAQANSLPKMAQKLLEG